MKTPLAIISLIAFPALAQEQITVSNAGEMKAALGNLKPGMILKIAPGDYPGGYQVAGISKLTITALDPANPPHFKGGRQAWHFSRCPDLSISHIRVSGQSDNGINLDDGGQNGNFVANTQLDHVDVSDIGPTGNHDGIKVSGLEKMTIRNCTFSGWAGSAIDFVGCRESRVTGCKFTGKPGFTNSSGIQIKGGSSNVTVEKCHFINAGERAINIGGSTGKPYFRPLGANYEARGIVVRDNIFEGGQCVAAFVGSDGGEVTRNTLLFPGKWVFRILHESDDEGFTQARDALIRDNRIVFRRAQIQVEINIGANTAPQTFRFEKNHWFAEDQPDASHPRLPVAETGGIYGIDPRK